MPWMERTKMKERLLFISRLEEGDSMAQVCKDFGISRTTGHKFWKRYNELGLEGLNDFSRRPYTNPKCIDNLIVDLILKLKAEKPHWGSLKIRELLRRRYPAIQLPARSTIDAVFSKHELVKKRRINRIILKAKPTELFPASEPNDLWCIDFKGQFRLKDRRYCYPLTITDAFSRYLIGCEALLGTDGSPVFSVFEDIFKEFGLPKRIRSDNGSPFASTSLLGLTRLSVWFLRLGISLERIKPGKPQENGRHERMHRTLKLEGINPVEENIFKQQEKFDLFRKEFNEVRPHQALNMKTPSELYSPSSHQYMKLEDLEYPSFELVRRVGSDGRISFDGTGKTRRRLQIGQAFCGENVGLKLVGDDVWDIYFMEFNLGVYNEKENNFIPLA
jgi:putative transposase